MTVTLLEYNEYLHTKIEARNLFNLLLPTVWQLNYILIVGWRFKDWFFLLR